MAVVGKLRLVNWIKDLGRRYFVFIKYTQSHLISLNVDECAFWISLNVMSQVLLIVSLFYVVTLKGTY